MISELEIVIYALSLGPKTENGDTAVADENLVRS